MNDVFFELCDFELNGKLKDIDIDLKKLNNNNFREYCIYKLISELSTNIGYGSHSQYPFDLAAKAISKIYEQFHKITQDIDIFLPDLPCNVKVDEKIINEYISVFIERSKKLIIDFISKDKFKTIGNVVIGITDEEKANMIIEQISEVSKIYKEKLEGDDAVIIDYDDFQTELINIDVCNDYEVNENECLYCKSTNIINLSKISFYCYDCEKEFTTKGKDIILRA
jgi:hypothetical protein